MKKILIYSCFIAALTLASCNDWLDVKQKDDNSAKDQFSDYDGFCDALNGCYILMKQQDVYGASLTMSNIEILAQAYREGWRLGSTTSTYAFLADFDYANPQVEKIVNTTYEKLYNIIAQANLVIENLELNGNVIRNESKRAAIEGEAYAIRAFCHFDILRLFGQIPKNATIKVSLPYAEKVSRKELPKFYDFDGFVEKVNDDIETALGLLKDSDPIFEYTFTRLNSPSFLDDDFWGYRQHRFNYWAVRAFQARFCLYTGATDKEGHSAGYIAKEIINAKGADEGRLIDLGRDDLFNDYMASPSECLMMLNAYTIMNYIPGLMGAGAQQIMSDHLVISPNQFTELFEGVEADDNRLKPEIRDNVASMPLWEEKKDPTHISWRVLRKYYYNIYNAVSITKQQAIPLLRLSEMYFIVMETTADLNEANSLYTVYKRAHGVLVTNPRFASLDEVRVWVIDEYRRELFAEGQMFFTYKRHGSGKMLWKKDNADILEKNYILPLPNTEYDPNL